MVNRLVMVVSLIYLSVVHLHRTFFDNGDYPLDITGPLMVITQKVTLLTFSIHDGLTRDENEMTKSQQFHAIKTLPTALEFFSYMLHFQSLMAGPLIFYKDYIEFIEGSNLLKHNANVSVIMGVFKRRKCKCIENTLANRLANYSFPQPNNHKITEKTTETLRLSWIRMASQSLWNHHQPKPL